MKPRVFVSSTFYDLKFIREDLSNFIKAHDFEPIMFEDGDIGYTPGKPLDSSCYDTMKTADMVILIIGGEYGSPATGEIKDDFKEYLSVTRKEFRAAAQIGIPIFVFIDANVYSEYGVYEVNYDNIENKGIKIEFKATKDTNVFRFIKEIRNLSDRPIQEFRRSVDIKSFLSKQWSDMFKSYLSLLRDNQESASLQNTVSDMEALIKKMSIMIDAVGKNVIGNNDKSQYDDIVKKQNEVEIARISQFIINGIAVSVKNTENRRANVEKLMEVIKNTFATIIEEHSSNEMDSKEISDSVISNLLDNMQEKGLFLLRVSYQFIDNISDIAMGIKDKEIEARVIKRLTAYPNYKKIFMSEKEILPENIQDRVTV